MTKINSTEEMITPERATSYLEQNTHNRPISQYKVDIYATDMKARKWELNGEPIIFDWDDVLQDGQHRLWACVESKTPFKTMVTRGVDPATFRTIDTGKARSSKDVLGIAKYVNVTTLSAAAAICIHYERGTSRSLDSIRNSDVLAYVEKHTALCEWVAKARKYKASQQFGSPIAAVAFLGSHRHPAKADEFITQFGTGENLTIGSPVLALRNRLFVDKKLRKLERLILIIMTWNAFVLSRSLSKTQMPTGNTFPKIAGAES